MLQLRFSQILLGPTQPIKDIQGHMTWVMGMLRRTALKQCNTFSEKLRCANITQTNNYQIQQHMSDRTHIPWPIGHDNTIFWTQINFNVCLGIGLCLCWFQSSGKHLRGATIIIMKFERNPTLASETNLQFS